MVDFPTEDMLGVEGVIAIPHLGASTPESEDNCAVMAADELIAYPGGRQHRQFGEFPHRGGSPHHRAAHLRAA